MHAGLACVVASLNSRIQSVKGKVLFSLLGLLNKILYIQNICHAVKNRGRKACSNPSTSSPCRHSFVHMRRILNVPPEKLQHEFISYNNGFSERVPMPHEFPFAKPQFICKVMSAVFSFLLPTSALLLSCEGCRFTKALRSRHIYLQSAEQEDQFESGTSLLQAVKCIRAFPGLVGSKTAVAAKNLPLLLFNFIFKHSLSALGLLARWNGHLLQ